MNECHCCRSEIVVRRRGRVIACTDVPGAVGLLKIERCDACQRFATDEEAERHVLALLSQSARAIELLDDVSAAFETVLYASCLGMPPDDFRQRESLVREARALCDKILRPAETEGEA